MAGVIAERGKKLLLVGNPNAGKSTLFNLLARGHARVGNWHGVTVGALEGKIKTRALKGYTLCDLPGIYALESMSMEEKFTRDYVLEEKDGMIVFVSECAGLERSLPLFFALCGRGRRGILVLTKKKAFEREGGRLDVAELSRRLGVAVIVADGKRGKTLAEEIERNFQSAGEYRYKDEQSVLEGIYTPVREGLSRADNLLTSGWFAVPLFLLLLLFAFFITFAKGLPGDLMKSGVETLFNDIIAPLFDGLPPVARSFFQSGVCASLGSVLCFLPQIALLFFFLTLMDESGLLSRLAMLTDGFFSKLGLNGRAVFSLVMGFGCTAAAVLTTRGLDDRRIQRRTILCLPYIPCSAKLPVFLTLSASLFANPFVAVVLLYALGVAISVTVALLLRKEKPPFLMELAPLRVPRPLFVLKALCFQIKQFIIKVATVILAFFLLSWLLSSFSFSFHYVEAEESMLAAICGWLKWLFAPIGMADWRIAYAAISGLVAKENIAGAIAMLCGSFPYGGASAFAFAVFVLTCSPCVSAISATAKELGWKRAILYAAVQTGSALLLSYLTYFALRGGAFVLPLIAVLLAAILLLRKNREKVSRKRRLHLKKLHR